MNCSSVRKGKLLRWEREKWRGRENKPLKLSAEANNWKKKKSHEDFAILISLLLQLEKDIGVISVLEMGRINIIRNAERVMGKRIWKELCAMSVLCKVEM